MKYGVKFFSMVLLLVLLPSLFSCGVSGEGNGKVSLENRDDSLSYAVSMIVAGGLNSRMGDFGIDSTTLDDFVRGMRDAFPLAGTPEENAYINGLFVALEVNEMIEKANAAIYPDEKDKKVNRRLFLEGLVATARQDTSIMDRASATNYYQHRVFRDRSEEFIKGNRGRRGVVERPSGLQYKIEKMGTGAVAQFNGVAECIYKIAYPNGVVVASTKGEPEAVDVESANPGLREALMTLPAGTRCKLYLPWKLAYGARGAGKVAPYSALVYDLEIVSVY